MLTLSEIECLQSKAVVFFGSALSLEILRIPPPAYNFCPRSMKSGYHSGYRLINDQGMVYFAMVYFKGTALRWHMIDLHILFQQTICQWLGLYKSSSVIVYNSNCKAH